MGPINVVVYNALRHTYYTQKFTVCTVVIEAVTHYFTCRYFINLGYIDKNH